MSRWPERERKGEQMGELSKSDAEAKRNRYTETLKKIKKNVREDFEEMDFENAFQRRKMEKTIAKMEKKYDECIKLLADMSFE